MTVKRYRKSSECLMCEKNRPKRQQINCFIVRVDHNKLRRSAASCFCAVRIYGFYDECKRRYNIKLWKTFTDCFNCLPVGTFSSICIHRVREKNGPPKQNAV